MITIRAIREDDAADWLRMRCLLWPDGSTREHRDEIATFFAGTFPRGPWSVLLAERANNGESDAVGFAEVSIRTYAEGCTSHRIGYLEGWFVDDAHRARGVGRALVAAAEQWARDRDCVEFASDTEPDNEASCAAHRALGFTDAGLVRCFHKKL